MVTTYCRRIAQSLWNGIPSHKLLRVAPGVHAKLNAVFHIDKYTMWQVRRNCHHLLANFFFEVMNGTGLLHVDLPRRKKECGMFTTGILSADAFWDNPVSKKKLFLAFDVLVFWVVTPCGDVVGTVYHHMASQPRRPVWMSMACAK